MARSLLAKGDESLRVFLTLSLKRVRHEVEAVGNGFEAIPLVAHRELDLFVPDIVMPGVDGIKLARRTNIEIPVLRVIFITGFAAVALRNRVVDNTNTKILSKPFHLRELVEEVDHFLAA